MTKGPVQGPFATPPEVGAMLPTGDTTSHAAHNWAFNQAAYIGANDLLVLLVLTHYAFYKTENPERAPVGQVLAGYSALDVLASWTGLSNRTVQRSLERLQREHGYLIRTPRPYDGEPGRAPRIIRLYWTEGDDATRSAFRRGLVPLPNAFTVSAQQLETWQKRSHLQPVLTDRYL